MAKAYKCDNCGDLYEGYQQAECISTDQKDVNAIKLIAYKGADKADICKKCMVRYAGMIQSYFSEPVLLRPPLCNDRITVSDDTPF